MEVTLNAAEIENAAKDLEASDSQVKKALRRAFIFTGRRARKDVAKRVREATRVKSSVLKNRIIIDLSKKGDPYGRIWIGLNPIPLKWMNPRQTRRGVSAGPARAPGAFVTRWGVFRRQGESAYPLDFLIYDIEPDARQAVESTFPEIADYFHKTFMQELNWEISK